MELAEEQSKWLRRVTDLLFPRYCVSCGSRMMESERTLCLHCLLHLPRTNLWLNASDNVLAKAYWGRTGGVEIEKAVAVFEYAPYSVLAEIIYDFKYYGKKHLAREMGVVMAGELQHTDFFSDIDCMVPVPLTRLRCFHRGYNQARILAQGIRQVTGIPVETKVLKRTNFETSQTSLSSIERRENVKDSFAINAKEAERLRGKHILLVDDVITTCATTCECCITLAAIPDVRISILALSTVQSGIIRREFPELRIEN